MTAAALPDSAGIPAPHRAPAWDVGRLVLAPPGRPLVMGVVNLSADSFYPRSRAADAQAAVAMALRLAAEGADILDVGAESSRPGAAPIGAARERELLLPVLTALRPLTALPISVDTLRAETAEAALAAGADAVNDISAGAADPAMLPLAGRRNCGLVLMHMQGTPATMQRDPRYDDVVAEVGRHLQERAAAAAAAGVAPGRIMVDPGIGFGKTLAHNLSLLKHLPEVAGGLPLLVGASRKRFIGEISGAEAAGRLPGSLAAAAAAFAAGACAVRVHDVAETVQFLEVMRRVAEAG